MDKYFDINETPLKYHNFLKYFALPVGTIFSVVQLFLIIQDMNSTYSSIVKEAYTIDLIFQIVTIVISCIAIYGFYTWKPCGYYGILGIQAVNVIYSFAVIGFCAIYLPELSGQYWLELLGALIVGIPICIYYMLRRPLFFEELRDRYWYNQQAAATGAVQMEDKSGGDPTRCRVCGEKLNAGRTACMKCGTAVQETTAVSVQAAEETEAAGHSYRNCLQCGNELKSGNKFCGQCGAKIE